MKTKTSPFLILFLFLILLSPSFLFSQIPAYVPTNGLVGYWPFNGNANDESGNGNNGTVNGATLTADRDGNANSAYYFDGTSNSIIIGNAFFDNGWNENSICFWFKPNSNTSNSCIMNTIPHDGTAVAFGLYGTNQKLYFGKNSDPTQHVWNIIGGNLGNHEFNFPLFEYSQWYNISIVKVQNTYSFYVNGILDYTVSSSITPISYYCSLIFGNLSPNQGYASEFYKGFLDEISIYNRALTSSEITAMYSSVTSIAGCTNNTACNYNASATQEDGSCTFPAQTYLTCAGTCINDTDGDGICNELEVPTTPAYLPTNGLVGYWPFNGNANDESGNGNHGTVNGATLTNDRNGNANSAYSFDGNTIEIAHNSDLGIPQSGEFSVSVWYDLMGNSIPQHIMGKRPNGSSQFNWQLAYETDLIIFGGVNLSYTGGYYQGNIQQNSWVHIVGTYSNGSWTVYYNSVPGSSIQFTPYPDTNTPLTFGNSGMFQPFVGYLDDIAIYNRALTLTEITALYSGSTSNGGGGGGNVTAGTPAESVPAGIPYQAVIRDNNGLALNNAAVTVRFSLHQGTTSGTVEYQETQALTTNAFGLINTQFGAGTATQGTFAGINWSNTSKFIQVEANTGAGYVDMGTQQMMSVPFALQANKATAIKNAGLPVYADNAAALAGGLVAGEMYRTATGDLKIVY